LTERDGSHERLDLGTAAGLNLGHDLLASLRLSAQGDVHHAPSASTALAFGARLGGRYRRALGRDLSLGADLGLDVRYADTVRRAVMALSPELRALASYQLGRLTSSLNVGFRLDRSRFAVRDPDALPADDRFAARLSRYNTLLLGAMLNGTLRSVTWTLEVSADPALGSSGGFTKSPIRVELAAQRELGKLLVGGYGGGSPSGRPDPAALQVREPRFWLGGFLGIRFDEPPPTHATPTRLAPPPVRWVRLIIRDAAGAPLAGAQVEVEQDPQGGRAIADAQGEVTLRTAKDGALVLRITGSGHDPQSITVRPGESAVTVNLRASLPAGQIRGNVRGESGQGLRASILLRPLNLTLQTAADGSFVFDVAPGDYQILVSAPGHTSQERPVVVDRNGVTILVIDLVRAASP
jgi:hypothetical protein